MKKWLRRFWSWLTSWDRPETLPPPGHDHRDWLSDFNQWLKNAKRN
jgi:hypothetical protein